ncbi:hypothetical protein N7450_006140 [Penicillium hetheringtonii]|uniref:Ribonucleases P/MRP subunit Pop8-like domain-containing protein n=1 Tax=Penicillium hetheringtonii TaxID=911720 RepID=A0AAD6DJX3_9EURO|nr:hypothetical protein N7450_006140 [Penicillium hetheringtonii]
MTENQGSNTSVGSPPSEPSKRKAEETNSNTIHFTSRNPPWTYLKLQLSSPQPLDALSARTYLSSALSQLLGLAGTAIPIDILKIENKDTANAEQNQSYSNISNNYDCAWVRVPREDSAAVVAALSSWIGGSGTGSGSSVAWRVCAKGEFPGCIGFRVWG